MKLAFVSDDETTISAHFGRAACSLIVSIENGNVVFREEREKLSHTRFTNEPHKVEFPGQPHGSIPLPRTATGG